MKKNQKTYYPTKTFDDNLEALVNLFKAKKWSFSGVDVGQLVKDAQLQRQERAEHDALEGQYFNHRESFGVQQQQRFERFSAALNAARGAFRNDKTVLVELDRFKKLNQRKKKTATTSEEVDTRA